MRIALFGSAFLFGACSVAHSQQINRINGLPTIQHSVEDAAALRNGDVALAGSRIGYSPSFYSKATLTRTAPDGTPLWNLSVAEQGDYASAFGVRERGNGELIVAFYSGSNDNALCLAAVKSDGTPLWANRYVGVNGYQSGALELQSTPNGDIAWVAGQLAYAPPAGGVLLGVDAATGTIANEFTYYPADPFLVTDVSFTDLVVQPGGDIFVIGSATHYWPTEQFDGNAVVARINPVSGAVIWCKSYGSPDSPDGIIYDNGRGIELTADGHVAIVIQTTDPSESYGPPSALHVLLDPTNGVPVAVSLLRDVQVANASLDRLTTGELLLSGSRTFGDGQSQARMWLLDPSNLNVLWVGEYNDGTTFGTDAIEHFTPDRGLLLTGHNFPSSIPSFGYPDQMYIKTDLSGSDGCSSVVWVPELKPPIVLFSPVELASDSISSSDPYTADPSLDILLTALVCKPGTCVGDLNGDGFVDDSDFVIFVAAYNILDCADPSMPPGCPGDLNGDGFVDDADFVLFVAAYNELLCP